jgi:parallel beta-helix repeat protein
MRLLGAITFSFFLVGSTVNAATYYVAPSGNDTAAGTLAAPFRTIKQASRVTRPGDVVNVRGGVYYESTSLYAVKGTATAPIVFRAMAGETPVLDGSKLAAGSNIVTFNQTEYVDFDGFELRNGHIGITVWHGKHTRLFNNHIHHTVRNGIYIGGDTPLANSDITISGNQVHDTVLENQYHAMVGGGWAAAVVVSRTERATITDNRIYNNDGEGLISLRSNYATIRGNEISDNYSASLYLDNARWVTADRNLIYSTGNTRYFRDGKPGIGIGVANETKDVMNPSSDNVFTNNIVIGTRWGFYYGNFESGGGLRNTKVLHNTFYGTTEEIIRIENDTHANSLVANNIFFQTGSIAPKYSGAGPVVYRNNLWYGGTSGTAAGAMDLYGDPMFVKAGGRTAADYKVRALSPAVHTAFDVAAVGTDFFGQTRTPSSDIGAHEESLSLGSSAPVSPAPLTPAAVSAQLAGKSLVRVSWTAPAGANRYNVYRNGQFFDTVLTNELTDATVAPATTYTYEVASLDARGYESPRSAAASVTTASAGSNKPEAPGSLRAIASSSKVDLAWTPVNGATGYVIYRDGAIVDQTAAASYVDRAVLAATTYSYRVVAVTTDGTRSESSETITVSTTTTARRRSVR